jgi:hypothetical protein
MNTSPRPFASGEVSVARFLTCCRGVEDWFGSGVGSWVARGEQKRLGDQFDLRRSLARSHVVSEATFQIATFGVPPKVSLSRAYSFPSKAVS